MLTAKVEPAARGRSERAVEAADPRSPLRQPCHRTRPFEML